MKTVTVFGSALPPAGSAAYAEARRLGRLLAEAGYAVCNGGYSGMMEATALGAREAGGHTIGITCALWSRSANPYIVEEIRTTSFQERLGTLIERGDAYIVLPGGTGTLAELALVWEMMNKGLMSDKAGHHKPLLVTAPYWQPVIDCLKEEDKLTDRKHDGVSPALRIITPFFGPEQALCMLQQHAPVTPKEIP